MELISGSAHVESGIGWFLKCGCALSECIVGVVVGLWALECWVVLWEVWLNEGDSVCWLNAGEQGGAERLRGQSQVNSK